MARCQAVDEGGFEELFRRYHVPAWRLAYAITGDRDLAGDATQEAFIQAFRAIRNVRPGSALAPWFYAIVANRARRLVARRRWRAWLPLTAAESMPDGRAQDALAAADWRDELWAAIRRLPLDIRVVLSLRYVLDLKEAEVASILRVPLGTVKSRLHRARRLLQESFGLIRKEDERCTSPTA